MCEAATHRKPRDNPPRSRNTPRMSPIELLRLINELIRVGTVTAVKSGYCRVKTGDNETNWRPYFAQSAGKIRTRRRLTVGEEVMLFSPGGDIGNAFVLGGINQNDYPEPAADDDNPDLHRIEYPDGAVIEYNPKTSALSASGIKTHTVSASVSIKLDTPLVECTKNLSVAGRITGETANIGGVEVTTHGHKGVMKGGDVSGEPVK